MEPDEYERQDARWKKLDELERERKAWVADEIPRGRRAESHSKWNLRVAIATLVISVLGLVAAVVGAVAAVLALR